MSDGWLLKRSRQVRDTARQHAALRRSCAHPLSLCHHAQQGCLSCKKSHLKCNEARPVCRRCSQLGMECTYPARIQNLLPTTDTAEPTTKKRCSPGNEESSSPAKRARSKPGRTLLERRAVRRADTSDPREVVGAACNALSTSSSLSTNGRFVESF